MKPQITKLSLSLVTILSLGVTSIHAENLLLNGSFEDFTVLKTHKKWKRVQLADWNEITKINSSGKSATDGSAKVALDSSRAENLLTQSISTVEGGEYTLSVDAYAFKKNKTTSDFEMIVDGEVVGTFTPTTEWKSYSVTFVGNGQEQTIGFREVASQNNNKGVFLDNAQLTLKESEKLIDLAQKFGKATQGAIPSYASEHTPQMGIDGDDTSSIYTGTRDDAWYQVELPKNASISKIVVKNSAYRPDHLLGARVYLSNEPYSGDIEEMELVGRLTAKKGEQVLSFDTPKEFSYIVVKNYENLHFTTLSAFGELIEDETADTTPPTITLKGANPLTLSVGDRYQELGADVTDDRDVNVDLNISGEVDTSKVGEYTLTYRAIDSSGNESNVTRVVKVTHDNLALLYGKATEGSNYYSRYPASNVLDNNNETFNHTLSSSTENWLQVELPEGVEVREVVVVNRATSTYRLNGAKVYLNSQSYDGSLNEGSLVGTLSDDLEQKIDVNSSKEGNFVLIKASGSNYLHVAEVKVYGTLGNKPYIADKNVTFGLDFNATSGAVVGKIDAKVKDVKALSYSIVGDVPFSIDDSGVITLNEALKYNETQRYDFKVKVTNDNLTTQADVAVKLLSSHGVKALRWGDIGGSSVNSFIDSEHYKNDESDKSFYLDNFDFKEDKENSFGQKMSAILRVPKSGFYTFAIIGDDGTRLDFNGIENFAYKSGWGSYQDWDRAGKSRRVYLREGEIYPITAYLKESGGAEHISIGWKMPDSDEFSVISAENLYREELTSTNVKPHFNSDVDEFTILKSENSIGDTILNLGAYDSQDELTYTIEDDVPFTIDENGNIVIDDSLEARDYEFDVKVSDGTNETVRHVVVHSPMGTKDLNDVKEAFLEKARAFDKDKSVDELTQSFVAYAHKKAQNDNDLYIDDLNDDVWQFIEDNPTVKEGLYASRFPVDPHAVKNLGDFISKWKEDGKDDDFIQKYKNVALGLSINAKARGIFDEAVFGDTHDHFVADYLKVPKMEAKKQRWLEHFDFKDLGYGIGKSDFIDMLYIHYKLSRSEKDSIRSAGDKLQSAFEDGYSIDAITPEVRKSYGISFDELNVYRVLSGLNRADCNQAGNPCAKIDDFIASENNETLTKSYILAHFKDYKSKIGLINARDNMNWGLASKIGVWPENQDNYRLMPFYNFANFKIANDNIPAKDFNDNEPNWPIFNMALENLPWQILALEQSAQEKECKYIKSRFFETDKSKLRESYPPNAVDGGGSAERRFIEYSSYTWDYDKPEIWFKKSDWVSARSYYRILQHGGVCGRQSTMGQHANECLSRPSIGTGQPGHRAWVGVYLNEDNPQQLQTNIGYSVGSRESATPHGSTIYNHYTSEVRESSLERFTGVITGVSPASVGEHTYNQSMILQHIGKILEEEGSASAEAVLKKAVELVPQNVDAWYQLALYYAKLDEPEEIIALADEYMQKRDEFFMEPDSRRGADNLEVVTGKNIAFTINKAPSIDNGKGDNAEWGAEALESYLNRHEVENRSTRSYRDLNRYFANYYLVKEQDESGFKDAVENLFERFVNNSSTGRYDDYFNGVNFAGINKKELFDELQDIVDEAQISKGTRESIYKSILQRDVTKPITEVNVNDICLDSNLSKCQSVQEFVLNANAIYMLVDNKIGEDKEVAPTNRGKEGYSTLTVAMTDNLGNDKDVIVRVAKVGTGGKLLKINDPSEVEGDTTKVVAWISPDENNLEENRIYTARQRVILHVKNRVTNNEESMGNVVLNIKDLMRGVSKTIDSTEFTNETIKDDETSVYFVALQSKIGPTQGVWWQNGYSTLNIPVVDNSGNNSTMHLRAYNDGYKMNAGINAGWDNTLTIKYFSEDNPNLESATEYKSIKPFTIDAKMWHKSDKTKKRYYFSIDITTP